MEYKGGFINFGAGNGVRVSRVAFGCGFRGTPDQKYVERIMLEAIETGINFIDCSNIYIVDQGILAEEILGRVLKQVDREKLVITSKVGNTREEWPFEPNKMNLSRFHIMREVERSLKRLGTDHIDIYFLHYPDPKTPIEETMRAMDQLVRDGKVRYIGMSNYKAWEVMKANGYLKECGGNPVTCLQNPYSLVNRGIENEIFPMIREYGLGMMVYNPLAAGLLGGQYLDGKEIPEKAFWNRSAPYKELFPHVFSGRYKEVINAIHELSKKYNTTMANIASAWVLSHDEIATLIAGANTIEEFYDILNVFNLQIEDEDMQYLTDLSHNLSLQLMIYDMPDNLGRIRRLAERKI